MNAPQVITAVDAVRTSSRSITDPAAECLECDWTRWPGGGDNWLAIRAAARRHVASSRHEVLVTVLHAYRYSLGPR